MLNGAGEVKKRNYLSWLLFGKGPLASTAYDQGAFLNTRGDGADPDSQIRLLVTCPLDPDGVQAYIKYGRLRETKQKHPAGVTMQVLAVRPKSRGSVGLSSLDPLNGSNFDMPKVNLNYFGHTADLDTLVAGIKVSRGIAEQAPFSKYLSHEQWPGSSANSDADLEVFVRSSACSGNALTGTWYHMPYGRICA